MAVVLFAVLGLLLLVAISTAGLAMRWKLDKPSPWGVHVASLESLFTVLAIVSAGAWYFIDRPTAPKIQVSQHAFGLPAGEGRVLVVVEMTLTNVGKTSIRFDEAPFDIYVQQTTPLPEHVEGEFQAVLPQGEAHRIWMADNWLGLAAIYEDPRADPKSPSQPAARRISTTIEAAEQENFYFRVILPCEPGLRVAVSSRLDKVEGRQAPGEAHQWIKQTFVDLSQFCPMEGTPG